MPSALLKSVPLVDLQERLWKTPYSKLRWAWEEASRTNGDADLCLVDRYFLLTQILRRKDALHPWVYERCREVEQAPDGYCDIWAREHYKSTIITLAGIIQEVLRNPELTVGIFSHTKPIAKGFLAQIQRELEANEDLKELFPDVLWSDPGKEAPSWSLDSGLIVRRSGNPKEGTVEAHGLVDGQPTSKHFNLLVYDDVVTRESVNTPEQIQKTTEAWELSDNLGTAGGRKWIIGTRYHYADTYAEIIKRNAARARVYPATHDGTISGSPVLFTDDEWRRRVRDQGEATVACQLLANPLAGHQRMFNVGDLQTYEVRPLTLMAYLLVDPGRSVKTDSDHTAMVVIGISATGNKYLLDGMDHKVDLMGRWQWMRDLWEKWSQAPGIVGLHVGYERFGAQADLDYFKYRMTEEKISFEIAELEWPRDGAKSKLDRVQRLTPDIRGKRFYLPYPTDENNLTRKQRETLSQGYAHLLADPIERLDEDRKKYDLSENLKLQVSYFPFGGRVDLIDAVSRLYDIDPVVPEFVEQTSLEPEYV